MVGDEHQNPIPGPTILYGSGGFGKTTLAAALCHHDDVITAFVDGVLWVTLGEQPNVQGELTKMYAALTGERPSFVDHEDAAIQLAEKLTGRTCLIVVDDVWDIAHLSPFLRGGEGCTRLITTRNFAIAAEVDRRISVDVMKSSEAVDLLVSRLESRPEKLTPFYELAHRLGEWPLLLELAGAALRKRIARGDTMSGALVYLNEALDVEGVQAFDQHNATERNRAVAKTIGASLNLLEEERRERYLQLAVFPEDIDIPVSTVNQLWRLNSFKTMRECENLHDLSLVRLSLKTDTIRLHDVIRAFLAEQQETTVLHMRLIDLWGDVHQLPDAYAWRHLAYHLAEAQKIDVLGNLLFDFTWLQAKLDATDVTALISDYNLLPEDSEAQHVQSAIRLAAHILAQDKTVLAGQLVGRLMTIDARKIRALMEQIKQWKRRLWLRPLMPTLTPPGGPLIRTLVGHKDSVNSVALTRDGRYAVSGEGVSIFTRDNSLKIWDLETGSLLRTLRGHTKGVLAVQIADAASVPVIVSTSSDQTLKVWDFESGAELKTLEIGEKGESMAVTPNGKRAVLVSNRRLPDQDIREHLLSVWDLGAGAEIFTLRGHTDWIHAVTVTNDGRYAISGASDKILIVWDLEQQVALRMLKGHSYGVRAVAATPEGRYAVSAGAVEIRSWDLKSGVNLYTVEHTGRGAQALTVTPDGRRALVALGQSDFFVDYERTLKLWDLKTGTEVLNLAGHQAEVQAVAITHNGRRAISASSDRTLKFWNLDSQTPTLFQPHAGEITAIAVTPNGKHALSASDHVIDPCEIKVWDVERRELIRTLEGHAQRITAIAVTPTGNHAVSSSWDLTVKLWDLATGKEIRSFKIDTTGYLETVAVTPDEQLVVAATNTRLYVWDTKTAEPLRSFLPSGLGGYISKLAVTPDGRRAIVAGRGDVVVVELESGDTLETCPTSAHSVATAAEPERAVFGKYDGSIEVWVLAAGFKGSPLVLSGHTECVRDLAITADGQRLVSSSDDHTLKMWDLQTGSAIASFGGDGPLLSCSVAPDGLTILAGTDSGRLHFLSVEEAQ